MSKSNSHEELLQTLLLESIDGEYPVGRYAVKRSTLTDDYAEELDELLDDSERRLD